MRFSDILKRSSRSLRQAKIRTLLTAAALAVGGFTLTATLAAANGAKAYGNQLIDTNFDPTSLIVSKSHNLFGKQGSTDKPQPYSSSLTTIGSGIRSQTVKELDSNDLTRLSKIAGVSAVFEDYSTNAQYITSANAGKYTGSLAAFNPYVNHQYVAGNASSGIGKGDVVIPEDYVSLLGFKNDQEVISKQLSISLRQIFGSTQIMHYKVIAVLASPSTLISGNINSTLLLNPGDAKAAYNFNNHGTVNYNHFLVATVKVTNGSNTAVLSQVEQRVKNAGYGAESAKDAQATITQVVNVLQIIIIVFGLITLIASFFGVVNTQYISVLERTREIGLMKALGMSNRSISKLFIVEAGFIGFVGAIMGSVAAIIIGELLNPWISKQINFNHNSLLIFHASQIFELIIFLVLIATIAGLLPARKAAKLDPIEALRTE